jgi:glutamate synthase domain-containing protein 2/glutamate synthase domain-containing protein 1/glutamate synthase domain-containing protein 3
MALLASVRSDQQEPAPMRRPYSHDPERDACGIGFVADRSHRASHDVVATALAALARVEHRGAISDDPQAGDGAGVLLPIDDQFFAAAVGLDGEDVGLVGLAMAFLPSEVDGGAPVQAAARRALEDACLHEGLGVAGWRDVPVDPGALGQRARRTAPKIEQAVLLRSTSVPVEEAEARAFRARKRFQRTVAGRGIPAYLASMSFRTVTYKALCAAEQLRHFYADLTDPRLTAPFVVFHQRYSTNTAPTWNRAQPFRFLCHNGEINTIDGNVAWMTAREGSLGTGDLIDEELVRPVIEPDGSDSAMLDNAVELLVRAGRDVRHAMAMLVPEAWEDEGHLPDDVRDFYAYSAGLTEPWDGPAGLVFTDGIRVGACLDRNGLRPLRWAACEDGLVVVSSESGVVDLDGHGAVTRGRLGPGQMLCVDPVDGLQTDAEIKGWLARRRPYGQWLRHGLRRINAWSPVASAEPGLALRQVVHGYTREELTTVLRAMGSSGKEPVSSMGDDTSVAVLASTRRLPASYLKQRFAQVTNPAIDPIRERHVMSLRTRLGMLEPLLTERPGAARGVELDTFLLTPAGLAELCGESEVLGRYVRLDATFPVADGVEGLQPALIRLAYAAEAAILAGAELIVVDDSGVTPDRAPVPVLLAVGAVHAHLIDGQVRSLASIVVDSGEPREVHHFATLLGYGAEAVCPRVALETVAALAAKTDPGSEAAAQDAYRKALEDGVLKVMSKMGISCLDSYRGAQIFDALGLADEVVARCFPGTVSAVGGVGFRDLAEDVLVRHATAYGAAKPVLDNPGYVKWRRGGEFHGNNPDVIQLLRGVAQPDAADPVPGAAKELVAREPVAHQVADDQVPEQRAAHALQRAVRVGDQAAYDAFAAAVNDRAPSQPRDLLELVPAATPVPLDEVEPAEAILRRFSTGAMSHGAIGAEAHEVLAQAMHLVGGRSNSGEGGEDPERFGTDRNSSIKQIASGRFGVTPQYAVSADELQIKVAQGSKPGEGGQIPAHKVTEEIARLRHTTPGVGLISPPPHHDIYSIEDLAQLIYDLKQVNPVADVSVKLVAASGVGTIAAGVAKAFAEVVHVSGADGGTGASPLGSIKNAGLPWELGLAETQQALMRNGLRSRVRVRVDGGFKTGRDVIVAALLGADEYSFGTAVLLAEGCIMVRACHRNTCPVGIATQDPALRAKFAGTPEQVAAYLRYVAEEVRGYLAYLGARTLDEVVGRTEALRQRRVGERRADALDLRPLLAVAEGPEDARRFVAPLPIQRPRAALGDRLHDDALPLLAVSGSSLLDYRITNADRSLGARLGGAVAARWGAAAPPGEVTVRLVGTAGQSLGAFLSAGITVDLTGEANDYVAKAMGGGRVVVRPPADDAGDSVLVGNTVLYGATGGELFVAGRAGERFAVRNSGATAVVEGTGDHACEYMTGGTVVVLGPTGRNLGAGMSGGVAFVHDADTSLPARVNPAMVRVERLRPADEPGLRALVERHAALTGSARATALLAAWDVEVAQFWTVAPIPPVVDLDADEEERAETAARP